MHVKTVCSQSVPGHGLGWSLGSSIAGATYQVLDLSLACGLPMILVTLPQPKSTTKIERKRQDLLE